MLLFSEVSTFNISVQLRFSCAQHASFKYVQIRLWFFWVFIAPLVEALFKYVIMLSPLNVVFSLNRFVNVTVVY